MKKQVVQLLDAITQRERSRRNMHGSPLQRIDFEASLSRLAAVINDFERGQCDEAPLRHALDNALSLSRASAALHTRFLGRILALQSRIPFDISALLAEEAVLSPKTAPWDLSPAFDA